MFSLITRSTRTGSEVLTTSDLAGVGSGPLTSPALLTFTGCPSAAFRFFAGAGETFLVGTLPLTVTDTTVSRPTGLLFSTRPTTVGSTFGIGRTEPSLRTMASNPKRLPELTRAFNLPLASKSSNVLKETSSGFFGVKTTASLVLAGEPSMIASACFSGRSTCSVVLPVTSLDTR